MSVVGPGSEEVTDILFKRQAKIRVCNLNIDQPKNGRSLLAAASTFGLIFVGGESDLRVVLLNSLVDGELKGETVPIRIVPLPSEPFQLALSCDHSLLAVDVVKNGVPIVQIYAVQSFLSNNVTVKYEIRVAPDGARTTQILWNPVMDIMFAAITESGGLTMVTLKPQSSEICALNRTEVVQCACWSPKGKQIVAGFANGRLMQYKPDLKPARAIDCPPNLFPGGVPFDTLALQWLSTYQFAAVFQSHAEEAQPALHIINAPKVGNPVYVNYDDVCYSNPGPRRPQVFLEYILPWNLLIVASANSIEVAVLGTTETGETPQWNQWISQDDGRAEFPLTTEKQETFPLGLSIDTGSTHQLQIDERIFPVFPMIHLYSTEGYLISFNLMNLRPNATDICSPPRPIADSTGLQHFQIPNFTSAATPQPSAQPKTPPAVTQPSLSQQPEMSFGIPTGATSTPTTAKPGSFFAPAQPKATNLFGAPSGSTLASTLSLTPTTTTPTETQRAPAFGLKPLELTTKTETAPALPSYQQAVVEKKIPLITVPSKFTPPASSLEAKASTEVALVAEKGAEITSEDAKVIRAMISEEIVNFEKDLRDLLNRSKNVDVTVGNKEELTKISKTLNDFEKLSLDAAESNASLASDIHSLRLGLNEAFGMVAEAKNKLNSKELGTLQDSMYSMSQTSRRQLSKLQNLATVNDVQLQQIMRQVDAQWCDYQDSLKRTGKDRMRVPTLEGLYQTLSKQKDIIVREQLMLGSIKTKLGLRENISAIQQQQHQKKDDATVESLTDSIISMSIADQIGRESEKLTKEKLAKLRSVLATRKVTVVQPKRPDRPGLNSEVVRERREREKRKEKAVEKKKEPEKTTFTPVEAPKAIELTPKPIVTATSTKPAAITDTKSAFSFAQKSPVSTSTPSSFSLAPPSTTKPSSSAPFSVLTPQALPAIAAKPAFGLAPEKKTEEKPKEEPKFSIFKPQEDAAPKDKPLSSFGSAFASMTAKQQQPSPIEVGQEAKEALKPIFSFGGPSQGLFGMSASNVESKKPEEKSKPVVSKPPPFEPTKSESNSVLVSMLQNPAISLTKIPAPTATTTTSKEASTAPAKPAATTAPSIFGGLGLSTSAASSSPFSFAFGGQKAAESKPAEAPKVEVSASASSGFSFSLAAGTKVVDAKPAAVTPAPVSTVAAAPTSTFSLNFGGSSAPATSIFGGAAKSPEANANIQPSGIFKPEATLATSAASQSAAPTVIAAPTSSAFSFTKALGKPQTTPLLATPQTAPINLQATTQAPVSSTTTTDKAEGLFSGFNIAAPTSKPATPQSTGSIFGATTTSIFGGSGGGSSGGMPKPDQSVFAAAAASPFAGAATSPFASAATSTAPPTSPFGNNNASPPATAPTSPFGASGAGIFGQAASGGSLFGGTSTFGQTSTAVGQPSIFGGAANNAAAAAGTTSPFGGFGSPSPSTPSIFGGGASSGTTPAFGQTSPFGQQPTSPPAAGGFGAAATFGAKSVFGASPTFGSTSPTFGGAPMFGSGFGAAAKPFGGMAAAAQPAPSQSNNLFEQLGASSTGMTFGNLAQSANQEKPPQFGGSSFSGWRG